MKTEQKLSEILKNLAEMLLVASPDASSSEAVSAALLFALVGWNRSLNYPDPHYQKTLAEYEKSSPELWSELVCADHAELISMVERQKLKCYPADRRIALVCGIVPPGKVHVEWCYKENLSKATRKLNHLIKTRPFPWLKANS